MIRSVLNLSGTAEPASVRLEPADSATNASYKAFLGEQASSVEISSVDAKRGTLLMNGKVLPFRFSCHDGRIELWMEGRVYVFEIEHRSPRRAGATGASTPTGDLTAPMPGTVLKINVADGDSYDAHDPLIVMESMKMEMSLSSPHSGRVAEIKCQVGDLVELGELLAKLEDA